jgi:hypothetical protein
LHGKSRRNATSGRHRIKGLSFCLVADSNLDLSISSDSQLYYSPQLIYIISPEKREISWKMWIVVPESRIDGFFKGD